MENSEGIGKRLKRLRIELDLKQGEFSEKIELSQGVLSEIESGKKRLVDRNIKLICLIFSVNEIWLRTGKGKMFKGDEEPVFGSVIYDDNGEPLNYEERNFINIYRKLTYSNKEVANATIDALLKAQKDVYQTQTSQAFETVAPPLPYVTPSITSREQSQCGYGIL